jgi:Predicted membrane protein
MYCEECGKKNKENGQFCEHCGKKMKNAEVPKEKKPMDKKTKIIVVASCALVAILIVFSVVYSTMNSPKSLAKEFFEATINYDADAMYKFLSIEKKSEFTSKKMFKKITDRTLKETTKKKVKNYTIESSEKSSDGLTTTVKLSYILEGSEKSISDTITFTKEKKNKLLFFENWSVSGANIDVVEDFLVKAPKGTKISIEGVKLDSKYLDKSESTKKQDVYKLPAMFRSTYGAKVTLPSGLEFEPKISVNSYSKEYTVKLTSDSIDDKTKEKMKKVAIKDVNKIYESIIAEKSFADIKSHFDYKKADLDDLEKAYDKLKSNLESNSTKLKSFKVTDAKVTRVYVDSKERLEATVSLEYDYKVEYTSLDETKTNESDDTKTVYVTFDYADGNFKTVDVSLMISYFSRY